jgi:hypothetical protein
MTHAAAHQQPLDTPSQQRSGVRNARYGNTTYTDREILAALQEVSSRGGVTPRRALSYERYGDLKRPGQPSEALVVSRFLTWQNACDAAGVSSGGARRPRDSYRSNWTDHDLFVAVRHYQDHAATMGTKATYNGYETYQRGRAEAPSGTLLRRRMAVLGIPTWSLTLTEAAVRVDLCPNA